MAKLNRLILFISLMLAGIMLLCACNTASVAPNEPTPTVEAPSPVPTSKPTPTATLTPTPTPEPEPEKPEIWACDNLGVMFMQSGLGLPLTWENIPTDEYYKPDDEAVRMLPLISEVVSHRISYDSMYPDEIKPAKSWVDNQHTYKNDRYAQSLLFEVLRSYMNMHPNCTTVPGDGPSLIDSVYYLDLEGGRDFMKILFDDFTDDSPMPDLTDFVPRASYPELTQTDTQYIIKGNISSAGGDYVAVNYYPYTRDNGENYYTFTLYRIWGDTSCYFALFEVTLHEISEPNPFGLKYAISSVIRLDNADFEFEA